MAKAKATPAQEAPAVRDMSAILAALPAAVKADTQRMTATEKARIAALAWLDTIDATFKGLDVLSATQRSKTATPELKAAHVALKEAFLSEKWGAKFLAKVNDADIPVTRNIGSPAAGMGNKPKSYWQQQKGDVWSGFVQRAMAFHTERAATAKAGEDGATKAPNRKAALDERCEANLSTAIKAMRAAVEAKKDKAETVPPHVNAAAFLALTECALLALSKDKVKQGRAGNILDVLRQMKLIS